MKSRGFPRECHRKYRRRHRRHWHGSQYILYGRVKASIFTCAAVRLRCLIFCETSLVIMQPDRAELAWRAISRLPAASEAGARHPNCLFMISQEACRPGPDVAIRRSVASPCTISLSRQFTFFDRLPLSIADTRVLQQSRYCVFRPLISTRSQGSRVWRPRGGEGVSHGHRHVRLHRLHSRAHRLPRWHRQSQRRHDEPRDSKRCCDMMLDFASAGSYHGPTTEGHKQCQQDRERRLQSC